MAEAGFKPGAAGWEARMLPLCYAHPHPHPTPRSTNFVMNFFADLVTSALQPSPLYFSTSTLNSVWPPKIYRQTTGISSAGVCSSLCSLDASTCELYVYIASSGICNLGWLTGAYSVAPSSGTGSEVMYTRIRELTHGAFNF